MKGNKQICTPFEFKQFAWGTDYITVFYLTRWLESKTSCEFTIVETKYLHELIEMATQAEEKRFKEKVKGIFDAMVKETAINRTKESYSCYFDYSCETV